MRLRGYAAARLRGCARVGLAMLPARRLAALRALHAARGDDAAFRLCREVEALCHAASRTADEYGDRVRRAAFNLRHNPAVGEEVVRAGDGELAKGTLTARIAEETRIREERFARMLQEKYEALDDATFEAIVRCRRCGSAEVSWDENVASSRLTILGHSMTHSL